MFLMQVKETEWTFEPTTGSVTKIPAQMGQVVKIDLTHPEEVVVEMFITVLRTHPNDLSKYSETKTLILVKYNQEEARQVLEQVSKNRALH